MTKKEDIGAKVNLTLTKKALQQLHYLGEEYHCEKLADVIRNSLSLFYFLTRKKHEGHTLLLKKGNKYTEICTFNTL